MPDAASSNRLDPRLPVLIGAGQVSQRVDRGAPVLEPVDLMVEASRRAADDSGGTNVLGAVDSVRVASILSWRYRNPGALVADRIGATLPDRPGASMYSTVGGNQPQSMVNAAALDIAAGRADLVLIGGGEAWRTRSSTRKHGEVPPWTSESDDTPAAEVFGKELQMSSEHERARGLLMPVQLYPMFENAWRAANGWSIDEHRRRLGALWSRFSEVAASNPHAWIQQRYTAEELVTPGPDNRMVGWPYPKFLNSNNAVEQGAAVLVCSVDKARSLGVPTDRWVFLHAGTDGSDTLHVSNRLDLHSSPAMRLAGRRALELAGIDADVPAHLDLYSCFPVAVQIAAHEIGLGSGVGSDRPLTVTGGLSFAGGPWNNYVTHAIATMAQRLRESDPGDGSDDGVFGLCTANGGFLTKHAFGVYGTRPPANGFRYENVQAEVDALGELDAAESWSGKATVEAYTVMHDRDGRPETGFIAARIPDGRRTWGRTTEAAVLDAMLVEEFVGHPVALEADGTAAF